jgi:hypothetical protein
MTWQQDRQARKIGVPLGIVERQIVGGNGEPPLWDYSDLFDDRQASVTIDTALRMNESPNFIQSGDARVRLFLMRLELLNAALSDLTKAGILAPQIPLVTSGHEFRSKIRYRERDISAGLEAYPEISRAYMKWIYKVGDIADPKEDW